ncbi:MAG: ABC transporter ATP-binding protein [Bacteroidales bacterium]
MGESDHTVLTVSNLSKRFGRIKAVDHLSFSVEQGTVYGLLGPNGSGKTTTLGIVLGVIEAGEGGYKWFGQSPSTDQRKEIGAMLEQPLFYPYLPAVENLKIICRIKNVPFSDIDRVLTLTELSERKNSRFRTFSYGMKQRLAIAAALLGHPKALILDEPTNGLDPKGISEIRNLIKNIASEGITIILASHLLDEVQKVCSYVAVLQKGKKIFEGAVSDIAHRNTQIELAATDLSLLDGIVKKFPGYSRSENFDDYILVQIKQGFSVTDLHRFLIDHHLVLSHLNIRKKTLEEQFLELLEEKES